MVPHLTTCIISLLSLSDYHLVFSFSFWINLFGLFFFFYFVNQSSSCKTFLFIIIISSSLLFSLSLTNFFFYCKSTDLKNQCKLICFLSFRFPDMWWNGDTSDERIFFYHHHQITFSEFRYELLRRSSRSSRKSMSNNGHFWFYFTFVPLIFEYIHFFPKTFWFANVSLSNWLFTF